MMSACHVPCGTRFAAFAIECYRSQNVSEVARYADSGGWKSNGEVALATQQNFGSIRVLVVKFQL